MMKEFRKTNEAITQTVEGVFNYHATLRDKIEAGERAPLNNLSYNLAIQCECAEVINEIQGWKVWKNKETKKEDLLDELADILLFYFDKLWLSPVNCELVDERIKNENKQTLRYIAHKTNSIQAAHYLYEQELDEGAFYTMLLKTLKASDIEYTTHEFIINVMVYFDLSITDLLIAMDKKTAKNLKRADHK